MNAKEPAISVCIPAYHAAKYLREALASVKAQTFTDWELILVEDGSDDGTRGILEEFSKEVSQGVKYIRQERNLGLTQTRNTGIQEARANWVALLDADDIWKPEHLETCLSCARKTDAAIIHGGSILFDSLSGEEIEGRFPTKIMSTNIPTSLFLGEYIIQPSSVMLKKSLWVNVGGFNAQFQLGEDREMWMKCARKGAEIVYTGFETCLYRKHPDGLSNDAYAMAVAHEKLCEEFIDWDEVPIKVRITHAKDISISAGRLCRKERPRQSIEHLVTSMKYGISIKSMLHYSVSLIYLLFSKLRSSC